MILRGLQHFPPLTVLQMRRQTQRGYSTSPKSQSSLTTEPSPRAPDHHLLPLSSQEDPTRLRVCTGFSVPPLCWARLHEGHCCFVLPSLAQNGIRWSPFFLLRSAKSIRTHFLCTKPARQLSAPIKECEMWLI